MSNESQGEGMEKKEERNGQDIMGILGLHVIGEDEDGGITVYSESSGKKSTVSNPGQVKEEKLVQLCGDGAQELVKTAGIAAIRGAIAQAAHRARRLSENSVRRQGIWETADGSVAVVADGVFCKWNGTALDISAPFEDGVFYDTTSASWRVDFPQLKQDLEQFDREKARTVFEQLCAYVNNWIWASGDTERNAKIARIVAALFVATFIQTIWNWRPQASITGESHSGKSTLFEFFRRILGSLAVGLEKSSPAGLRQALRSSASVCMKAAMSKYTENG